MTAPEPVEVPADELAAAEARLRDVFGGKTDFSPLGWYDLGLLLAEYDRMKAELAKAYADCGICKLGGRMIYIKDECPEHGDHDGIS